MTRGASPWLAAKGLALPCTVVAIVLACGSCSGRDQCTPSEAFCNSPEEFRQCVTDYEDEDRPFDKDRNVWSTRTCAAGYSCVEASERNASSPSGRVVNPSCVMTGDKHPACSAGMQRACDGDQEISCVDGFATSHGTCINCEIGSDGFSNCDTSNGRSCERSDECPPGLECLLVGQINRCTTTCECEGGSACDACTVYGLPNQCFNGVCSF